MTSATFAATSARRYTLRQVLGLDALTCASFGLLLLAASSPLSALLGLPEWLLFYAGVVLLPCAAAMALAAKTLARPLAWTVIAGNAAWVVASLGVLTMFEVTTLGMVFVLAQAVAVSVLTLLEWRAVAA